jgi:hypothetical protein
MCLLKIVFLHGVFEIPRTTRSFVMRKFPLAAVFVMIPIMAFSSGSAISSSAPVAAQSMTCTTHDLLVQKIDNAYHTQFPTSCDPVNTSTTRASASGNGDTISGNQELPQQ